MKISGSVVVPHPVEAVWDAILDPAVLVRTIPGCSRLEVVGEHSYAMTVTAGVAAIKGTYDGTCTLGGLVPGKALTMRLTGAGAPGTIDAAVDVAFGPAAEGGTTISYDADATVGGMVGGVGQRMLTSVSKRMAGEFFGNVADAIAHPPTLTAPQAPPRGQPDWHMGWDDAGRPLSEEQARQVFEAPAKRSGNDFARGIAVGAGLVLLGVLAGRVLGRR